MGDIIKTKQRLEAYRESFSAIESENEKLERVLCKMYTVGCPDLSGMPRAATPGNDMLINIISRRDTILDKVRELQKEHDKEKTAIAEAVGKLSSDEEKRVITARYLEGKTWMAVTASLYGQNNNFTEKERAYRAKVYRIRDNAIIEMSNFWFA